MSTCIIHVGMHKTGSTSIQNSLDGYSDDEFYYASLGESSNHSLPIFSLFSPSPEKHHLHRANGRNGRALKKYIDDVRLGLKQSIAEANGRTMIISGERVSSLPIEVLFELRRYFSRYFKRIKIEAYVRPPAAYINSAFQERVKGGGGSMNTKRLYRSYKNIFAKFDEVFGRENVHLSKFNPKAFANECVVTDFCLRLGINLSEDEISTVNESLSLQAIGLLYTYNKFVGDLEAPPLIGREAISLINGLNIENKKKFRFSSELLASILEANRNDIAWMERRMADSLHEGLPNHEQGDVQNESDLLQIDADVIKQLRSCLGKSAPKNVSADTADGVAQLVHAVRKKMGLNITRNQPKAKRINEQTILNRARINRAEPGVVTGWAIGPDSDQPVKVTLLVNGKKRASTTANEMRKGIQERGIHPSGFCGFKFKFGIQEQLEINDEVSIDLSGGGTTQGQLSLKVTASDRLPKKALAKIPDDLLKRAQDKRNEPKEIILHVGHGKTGSSYLQSALALSSERLKSIGIDYPSHPSFAAAKTGLISSGNVLGGDEWLSNLVAKAIHSKQKKILFSNEGLFLQILANHSIMADVLQKFKIKIILFIRNPWGHMLSKYGQGVKRSGHVTAVNDAANRYNIVQRVDQFVDLCNNMNIELKVINYSKRKHELSSAFEEALNIPAGTLEIPKIKNINRSLTTSELEFQRLFNVYFEGHSSRFISDILCNELPDITPEKIKLSDEAASKFISRISKDVECINKKLDADCQYSLPSKDTSKDTAEQDVFTFSKKQLEVLISSICKEMNRDNGSAKNKDGLSNKLKKSSEQIKRLKRY